MARGRGCPWRGGEKIEREPEETELIREGKPLRRRKLVFDSNRLLEDGDEEPELVVERRVSCLQNSLERCCKGGNEKLERRLEEGMENVSLLSGDVGRGGGVRRDADGFPDVEEEDLEESLVEGDGGGAKKGVEGREGFGSDKGLDERKRSDETLDLRNCVCA
jgi:hypothetical protein